MGLRVIRTTYLKTLECHELVIWFGCPCVDLCGFPESNNEESDPLVLYDPEGHCTGEMPACEDTTAETNTTAVSSTL